MRRYKQEWSAADSLNASIGQGYVSVSPLQLAVMVSRIASGKNLLPSLLYGQPKPLGPALPFTPEELQVPHDGMFNVVNGHGTGVGSKLQVPGIMMAGKTGTAQVRALTARGHVGDWKSRDHSLFIGYAPTDTPRYAMSVVVEHGTFGARAAAPIARDVLTYLFDPGRAWDTLLEMEKTWGGTPMERMQAKYRAYASEVGTSAPEVGDDEEVDATITKADNSVVPVDNVGTTPDTVQDEPPSPGAAASPSPSPAPTPSPTGTPAR
jgi:penicillin-binding protein 2